MISTSSWVLIGTALFLGAVALFVPYLAELVKRRAFAPDLLVYFEETPPICLLTYWRVPMNSSFEEPVFFFRFQVTNDGKSQARQCEAVLEKIWVYDASGKPHALENFIPVNLRSVERGKRFVDINPKRRVFWNIGRISSASYQDQVESKLFIDVPGEQENGLRFLLELIEYPNSQANCFVPGKYRVKISLYSENAGHKELHFEVVWSGKWQQSESDMFREVVITQVPSIS